MNKIILIGSICAIFILVLVSFTQVVNAQTTSLTKSILTKIKDKQTSDGILKDIFVFIFIIIYLILGGWGAS